MTSPSTDPAAPPSPHTCEHCAGGGTTSDPAAAGRRHLALAARRLPARFTLGLLGLGVGLVLAERDGTSLGWTALVYAGAALGWFASAWSGMLLGALLARRRSPAAQLALGRVLATSLGALTALFVALWLVPLAVPEGSGTAGHLATMGVTAAAGWFLAGTIGEWLRLRSLRRRLEGQSEIGSMARAQAEAVTLGGLQRGERAAVLQGVAFGAATALLTTLPIVAVVLVPLGGAGAAWLGLRDRRTE